MRPSRGGRTYDETDEAGAAGGVPGLRPVRGRAGVFRDLQDEEREDGEGVHGQIRAVPGGPEEDPPGDEGRREKRDSGVGEAVRRQDMGGAKDDSKRKRDD